MVQNDFELCWYALQVKPNQEDPVSTLLAYKGYSTYVPRYRAVAEKRGRRERVERKLFPGYVFCEFAPGCGIQVGNGAGVVTTAGVIRIVGAGNKPIAIPGIEIESIRCVLASGLMSEPWSFLKVGQRIEIDHGPLKGLRGLLLSTNNVDRMIVSIDLLQRSLAVQIQSDWMHQAPGFSEDLRLGNLPWQTLADRIAAGSAATAEI